MPDVLSTVQATFTTLDTQYNLLLAACRTQQERDELANQYAVAQEAYQRTLGQILTDDDPKVAALSTQLKAANAVVRQSVNEMGDMNKVIDNITTAVTLAAQMVAMFGPGPGH